MTSFPTWTADGKHVTFAGSGLGSPYNLYWMPADGSGASEALITSENMQFPGSWSPDGHMIAFSELVPETGYDIWLLELQGERNRGLFSKRRLMKAGQCSRPTAVG
jgi:Tol biopolymer transport system component